MDPLSALMQRYCFAYTATHDFSVADQILADDYVFQMGSHVFTGREEAYKPAAERQLLQLHNPTHGRWLHRRTIAALAMRSGNLGACW